MTNIPCEILKITIHILVEIILRLILFVYKYFLFDANSKLLLSSL